MRDNQKIKIGFFGTPEFSLTFLKYLFEKRFNINFVVSQPPAKSGRGKKIICGTTMGRKKELKLLLLKQQAIVFLKGNFEYKSRFYCCGSIWKYYTRGYYLFT